MYLLNKSNGVVSVFDEFGYLDIDQYITCTYITSNQDFGSYRRKYQHRLTVVGDVISGNANLYWSDDDYNTWSNAKSLDLSLRPVVHRGGQFRRRAYKFVHQDNTPLRIEAFEVQLTEGST